MEVNNDSNHIYMAREMYEALILQLKVTTDLVCKHPDAVLQKNIRKIKRHVRKFNPYLKFDRKLELTVERIRFQYSKRLARYLYDNREEIKFFIESKFSKKHYVIINFRKDSVLLKNSMHSCWYKLDILLAKQMDRKVEITHPGLAETFTEIDKALLILIPEYWNILRSDLGYTTDLKI